jgi:hypothetical protein
MTIGSWVDGAVTQLPGVSDEQRRRAARCVASQAVSAAEAAEILDALGLTVEDGLRPAEDKPAPVLRATA